MSEANNPFIPSGREYGAVDTDSRLRALKDFDLEQCRAALALPGLQKTVEKKLQNRIRALEKLATTAEQADDAQGEREAFKLWHLNKFGLVLDEGIAGACQERWAAWQARAALAQPSPAPELKYPEVVGYACLDDMQWGGDITLRPEKSEHYSVPFAPVAQAGQVPEALTEAQMRRLYENSTEAENERLGFAAFARLMRRAEAVHQIAAAPAQGE